LWDYAYADFELTIEETTDGYRARVLDSPVGTAEAAFELDLSENDLKALAYELQHQRGVRRREAPRQGRAREFGKGLFDAVFSGDVEICYRRSLDEAARNGLGLRLRLTLASPSLANVPWEFLHSTRQDDFIVLSTRTPLVRFVQRATLPSVVTATLPLRVLVMISSPSGEEPLDVEREWQLMQDAMADSIASGHIEMVRVPDGSMRSLRRILTQQSFHIFHFIGHGGFDEAHDDGVLVMEHTDGSSHTVSGRNLGTILSDHKTLRVVVLNACDGARTSAEDPAAGSAQSLVRKGIPAVIANQFLISDRAAITLAHDFYGGIADGLPVDAALAEARRGVFASGNDVEWATPVLYLCTPSGEIFDIDDSVPPVPAAKGPAPEALTQHDSGEPPASEPGPSPEAPTLESQEMPPPPVPVPSADAASSEITTRNPAPAASQSHAAPQSPAPQSPATRLKAGPPDKRLWAMVAAGVVAAGVVGVLSVFGVIAALGSPDGENPSVGNAADPIPTEQAREEGATAEPSTAVPPTLIPTAIPVDDLYVPTSRSAHTVYDPLIAQLEALPFPLRLPSPPGWVGDDDIFANAITLNADEYYLSLDLHPQCQGATVCNLGAAWGAQTNGSRTEVELGGSKPVFLASGQEAWFTPFACGASCGSSTVIWFEGAWQYGVALKSGEEAETIEMADTAYDHRAPHRVQHDINIAAVSPGTFTVDGKSNDWVGFERQLIDTPIFDDGSWNGRRSAHALVALARENNRLFVLAEVFDDIFEQNNSGTGIFQGDALNLNLAPADAGDNPGANGRQITLTANPFPGAGPAIGAIYEGAANTSGFVNGYDLAQSLSRDDAELFVNETPKGYVVEASLDLSVLAPNAGRILVSINDSDGANAQSVVYAQYPGAVSEPLTTSPVFATPSRWGLLSFN